MSGTVELWCVGKTRVVGPTRPFGAAGYRANTTPFSISYSLSYFSSSYLSALDAFGPVQWQPLHGRHLLVRTSPNKANRADPLNLLTDRHAPPALDALIWVKGNGVIGRVFRRCGRLTVCGRGNARPAIPLMVVFKGLANLSRRNVLHLSRRSKGGREEGDGEW